MRLLLACSVIALLTLLGCSSPVAIAAGEPALVPVECGLQPPSSATAEVEVDPTMPYYQNRSPQSIAQEVAAHGYRVVHYEASDDAAISGALIDAFRGLGISVWYTTFINGSWTESDLPSGWQSWKMVTRGDLVGKPVSDGFDRFCLNNPGYLAWKRASIVASVKKYRFDGVDLKEPFWPDYPGPDSPTYGCFCADCRNAFLASNPGAGQLPDIVDAGSKYSPSKDPALWKAWNAFRRKSVVDFLSYVVNGPGGLRQECPGVQISLWSLALLGAGGMEHVRDDNGLDEVAMAGSVQPDRLCLETHWPDWSRPDLPSNYVLGYEAFLARLRRAGINSPVSIEADLGSTPGDRRSGVWIDGFMQSCRIAGFAPPLLYEFSLGLDMYTQPPVALRATPEANGAEIVFSKRLDASVAADSNHYSTTAGRIDRVEVDGATVRLKISSLVAGQAYAVTAEGLADTPELFNFPSKTVHFSAPQTVELTNPG